MSPTKKQAGDAAAPARKGAATTAADRSAAPAAAKPAKAPKAASKAAKPAASRPAADTAAAPAAKASGTAAKASKAAKPAKPAADGAAAAPKKRTAAKAADGASAKPASSSSAKGRDGEVRRFARENVGGWNHGQWLDLLGRLRDGGHDTADEDSIGLSLERERLTAVLEDVEGLGPRKAQAIVKRFDTVYSLNHASDDELHGVSGITPELAQRIRERAHRV